MLNTTSTFIQKSKQESRISKHRHFTASVEKVCFQTCKRNSEHKTPPKLNAQHPHTTRTPLYNVLQTMQTQSETYNKRVLGLQPSGVLEKSGTDSSRRIVHVHQSRKHDRNTKDSTCLKASGLGKLASKRTVQKQQRCLGKPHYWGTHANSTEDAANITVRSDTHNRQPNITLPCAENSNQRIN